MSELKQIQTEGLAYKDRDKVILSVQSANSLFNFMRQTEYLKLILRNKAFIPRYYEEVIDYLGLDGVNKIAFPMTCFCDIHVQKIKFHCSNYGNIGIGMNKSWGIKNGIQPIHYINDKSRIFKELIDLFKIEDEDVNEQILEPYKNYLLEHLIFIKPLQGEMYRKDKYESTNFHDEKEWRYIPNIASDIDLPEVISDEIYMNQTAYNTFSKGILSYEKLWLKFEYSDIKYLLLENEADRYDIIQYINNEIDISIEEKFILASKIIILDSIGEDL
ncbi:abortive infection system antitoxin AbiGi family protein [Paraclostridium dentum]|uniref:abortive infection system antitoxin AbiGi family protein n=1 Tax=Paraclostridium dentum TaxID=2662455 RepID=UPI0034646294